jgi:hypothetical protein
MRIKVVCITGVAVLIVSLVAVVCKDELFMLRLNLRFRHNAHIVHLDNRGITLYPRGLSSETVEAVNELNRMGLSQDVQRVYFLDGTLDFDVAQALTRLPNLMRVTAHSSVVDKRIVDKLHDIAKLEELDISSSEISCEALSVLISKRKFRWIGLADAQIPNSCRQELMKEVNSLSASGVDTIKWVK